MQSKQTLGSAIDAVGPSRGRDLSLARDEAQEAMHRYATLLRAWLAPDDEHTILTLRGMVNDVIDEVVTS